MIYIVEIGHLTFLDKTTAVQYCPTVHIYYIYSSTELYQYVL